MFKNIFLITVLILLSHSVFGQWYWGSKNGKDAAINLTPNNQIANENDSKTIEFGTVNPSVVAVNASQGSLYVSPSATYQKTDNGLSTNWQPLLIGPGGSGTDNCVARWDGTGSPTLQDSLLCITDLGVASGLTQFNIENLRLDGNTISSTDVNGDINLAPNGTGKVSISGLTASRPLKLDASNKITSSTIDLASSSDVNGVLPESNGGTNQSSYAVGDTLYASALNTLSKRTIGANGDVLTVSAGVPVWSAPAVAVTTIGAIDSQAKAANGAVISGANLYMQTADASFPGLVSTGAQTIAGNKTITGTTNLSALTASTPLKLDASKNIISTDLDLTTDITGVLPLANGGTNKNATASNGAFVYSDSDSFELSGIGTAGQPVLSGGAGAPTYFSSSGVVKAASGVLSTSNVDLTTEVTGTLPVSNGGTGSSTLTANNVILGNGTSAVQFVAPGTSGNVLTSNGTTWQSTAPAATTITIGAIDSQAKSANGAVASGTTFYQQTADASFPGLVSTGTQTFSGDKTLTGTINLSALTASRPLKLDGSKNITSTQIDLSSTNDITNNLLMANGGTNKSMTASNGAFVYSDADSFELSSVGTAGQPILSGGAGAPTYFSSSGVVKAASGVLSTSNVNLASEVTGTLPVANGGTNSSTALNNNRVIVSSGGSIVENAALTASAPMRTDGSGLPTTGSTSLTTEVSGTLPIANGGTNITTYTTGDTLYSSASNVLSKLAIGTKGQNLKVISGIPSWKEPDFNLDNLYQEYFEGAYVAASLTTGDNATPLGGGTISGTVSDETTNFINGASNISTTTGTSVKYTQAAGSLNDYICGPEIDLSASTNRKEKQNYVGLSFFYKYDGASGDIKAGIMDISNNTFLATSLDVLNAADVPTRYATANYLPSTTQKIRWCLQTVVLNSGKILYFDDVQLSNNPYQFFQVNNITPWVTFTPTGTWSTNTSWVGVKRRNGDTLEMEVAANLTGAPTGTFTMTLPDSLSIDTSKITSTSTTYSNFGYAYLRDDSSTANRTGAKVGYNSTTSITLAAEGAGQVDATTPFTWANLDNIFMQIKVPISGWNATVENLVTPANSPRQTTLTTTGTGWTDVRSIGVYYRTSDGAHRLKFNIYGTVSSSSRTSYTIAVSGVTFKNVSGYDQAIAAYTANSPNVLQAYVSASTSNISLQHSSATTTYYIFSGDVELNAKPTWADDVHTQFMAAVPANIVTSPESTHTQPKVCSFQVVNSTDVASNVQGSCLNSTTCSDPGTGGTTCTFKSGYWTNTPICMATALNATPGNFANIGSVSTTSITQRSFVGTTLTDATVYVMCHGY